MLATPPAAPPLPSVVACHRGCHNRGAALLEMLPQLLQSYSCLAWKCCHSCCKATRAWCCAVTLPVCCCADTRAVQNKWAHDISWTSAGGFLLSNHAAPAHTAAHVGMLSLMFAAAEQQQGGRVQLVQSLECFAMKIVSAAAAAAAGSALTVPFTNTCGFRGAGNWECDSEPS